MHKIPEIIQELREAEENGSLMSGSLLSSKQKTTYGAPSPYSEDALRNDDSKTTTLLMETQLDQQFQNWDNIYRSLFEHSPDGIVIVDVTGKILSCNPATLKMTGYDAYDLIGKHFSKTKIFDLKEIPNILNLFSKILSGNYQGPFELKYYRKDGSYFWSEVHISLLKNNGHICGLVAISRDITERKEAERRIQHSEKLYRELYEGSRDGFALVNMNGSIIESNGSFQKMLGYSAEELKEKNYKDITLNKWHAFENEILEKQVLVHGYSEVYEKEYRHKNGTIIPVEIRTYLLKEEGKPKGMWAFVRNISERKQKEYEIEESKSHFQHLFNAIADPIVIVDRHGKFLEISDGV
jgi:PAS domain S-box-containing protein